MRPMKWMNYNHLYYFWVVGREGGVVRASEELMVSQPTISNQLTELEAALGHRLFARAGAGGRSPRPARPAAGDTRRRTTRPSRSCPAAIPRGAVPRSRRATVQVVESNEHVHAAPFLKSARVRPARVAVRVYYPTCRKGGASVIRGLKRHRHRERARKAE